MLAEALARRACVILAGLLALALIALAGVWLHGRAEAAGLRADLAEARATHSQFVATAEAQARRASEAARAEEQRRQEAHREIVHLAKLAAARDADARARRAAVSGRVRDHAADLAGRCAAAGDPAAASGGPTAAEAGALLADMLGRLEAAAGEFAAYADAAATAGQACERAADALKPGPPRVTGNDDIPAGHEGSAGRDGPG